MGEQGSPLLVKCILKGGLGKAPDGVLSVVHAHAYPRPLKLLHLPSLGLTPPIRGEHQL